MVFNSLTRNKTLKRPLYNLEVSTSTFFQEFPEKKLTISINLNNATNKSLKDQSFHKEVDMNDSHAITTI